ncbi:MAG: hypothetical protein GF310_07440 [candidate division Zixibacteria bacterium]|nr:hypothetical protein [candidate division Zixibacteria bacterium]
MVNMRRHACFWIGPVLFVLLFAAIIVIVACSDKSSGPKQIPVARIASISPERGPVQTRVEIRGENFGEDIGSIVFKDKSPYVALWSDTLIKADVPEELKEPCYVHISSKSSEEMDSIHFIVEAMQIESIVPDHGLPGYEITINGSGFGSLTGTVLFDSLEAEIITWSFYDIVVLVPENATSCNIEVQSQGRVSNLHGFAIDRMTITKIIPNRAIPGTEIEIHGYKFGSLPGSVRFQDANGEIINWTDTLIITEVPYSASPGDLVVEFGGATSNALSFQVEQLHIREIIPDSATYDEQIEIHGSFYGADEIDILFGDSEVQSDEFNDTLILTTVPPGVDSSHIIVTANDLESNSVFFKVLHMTITSVEPDSGIVGQKIAIHGRYFGNNPGSVYFGDIEAAIDGWTDTLIYARVSEGLGLYEISVSNQFETSNAMSFEIVEASDIFQILQRTNSVSVTLQGYHVFNDCWFDYCDSVWKEKTLGVSIYNADSSSNWHFRYFADSTSWSSSEPPYSSSSRNIYAWLNEDGTRIDSLFAKHSYSGEDYGLVYRYGGQILHLKSLQISEIDSNIISVTYSIEGIAVRQIADSIEYWESENDVFNNDETSFEYLDTDWSNEDVPAILKVVFWQE